MVTRWRIRGSQGDFTRLIKCRGASCSGLIPRHFHALGEPSGEPLGGNLRKGGGGEVSAVWFGGMMWAADGGDGGDGVMMLLTAGNTGVLSGQKRARWSKREDL